jgi:hypothetical protein
MKAPKETKNQRHTGWRVTGYILVALTVLLSIGALRNLATSNAGVDMAGNFGRIVGTIGFPVAIGFLARYCLRKSRNLV